MADTKMNTHSSQSEPTSSPFLRMQAGKRVTSDLLASSIDTNPSLGAAPAHAAGQIRADTVADGHGRRRAARPSGRRITLTDVLRVVDEEGVVIPFFPSLNPTCPIGCNISSALDARVRVAERAMEAELSRPTIADLAAESGSKAGGRPPADLPVYSKPIWDIQMTAKTLEDAMV